MQHRFTFVPSRQPIHSGDAGRTSCLQKLEIRMSEAFVDTTASEAGAYWVHTTGSLWALWEFKWMNMNRCWMKTSEANEPWHGQHLITSIPQHDALTARGRTNGTTMGHSSPRRTDQVSGTLAFGADRGSKASKATGDDTGLGGPAWMIGHCSGGAWNGGLMTGAAVARCDLGLSVFLSLASGFLI